MNTIRVIRDHGHHIQVTGDEDDRQYRIICPDGGANCECWVECQQTHRCNCGGEHGHDDGLLCPSDCDEDHSTECTEWLDRDDGELHGEEHRWVAGMICIRDTGCWMPEWDIEFDQINYRSLYPPGVYEFDYEDPDDDMGGCLYVLTMRPVTT